MSEKGIALIQKDDAKILARCNITWSEISKDKDISISFLDAKDQKLFEGTNHIVSYVTFSDERSKIQCFLKEPLKRTDGKVGPIVVELYMSRGQYKTVKTCLNEYLDPIKKYKPSNSDSNTTFAPIDRCSLCINDIDPPIEDGHGVGKCVPPVLIPEQKEDEQKKGRWWWFW
jgi:hypothetical protein